MPADAFRGRFPRVALDAEALFMDDSDTLTSAGAASGLDVCLPVVRKDHGSELSNRVARRRVVPPLREGRQAQYIEQPAPDPSSAGAAATRKWALERPDEPLALAVLAGHARMSVRTPSRAASRRRPAPAPDAGSSINGSTGHGSCLSPAIPTWTGWRAG
ncbi:MAG: hypothetical protein ACJ736_15585 [Streptomyces sp.]